MNHFRLSIALSAAALLLRCSNLELAGPSGEGNGSETIAGVIVDSTGAPAAGVAVALLPGAYDPVTPGELPAERQVFTNAKGEYRVDSIASGTYAIEAVSAGLKSLIKRIEISGKKIEVPVDTGKLQKTGTIRIQLSGMALRSGDYVYLPGTHSFVIISSPDSAARKTVLSSVPAGKFTELFYVATGDYEKTNLLTDTLTVLPGDTIVSAFAAWKYSRKIFLNTTASGANSQGNVCNFPVLVRLTDATFNFSQSKSGGEDIRFAKSDGLPLSYEIEQWDANAREAEIWVKVDTVYGNSGDRWIAMYWGNPGAANASNPGRVFDTADGFQGVWHLNEPANAVLRDATPNRYDGMPTDTAPARVQGAIGIAREFNGVSNGIRMTGTAGGRLNFPENGRYSVSAWVYSDTLDDQWRLIVGKSNGQYYLKQQINSRTGNWEFVEYQDKSGWQISQTPVSIKTWKLLTGIRDGDKQYLYLDGQLVDSSTKQNYDTASRTTSDDVTIGKFQKSVKYEAEGYCFFKGKIDEVRISNVVCSADWIKLSFMNQREDDRLVMLK